MWVSSMQYLGYTKKKKVNLWEMQMELGVLSLYLLSLGTQHPSGSFLSRDANVPFSQKGRRARSR